MSVAMFRRRVDPRKLAGRAARLEGELPANSLPRVWALLVNGKHENIVRASLDFRAAARDQVLVSGDIDARLTLQCQRCLEPVTVPIKSEFRFVAEGEAGDDGIPAGFEPLENTGEGIVPADIVEEELLLALPLAAVHESLSECGDLARQLAESGATEQSKHPFAVLKSLKLD